MTQQVLKVVTSFTSLDPNTDDPSFQTHWEQVGTNTNIDQSWVAGQIEAFFNTTASGASSKIATYMAPVLSRAANACTIDFYDVTAHLDGSPAGSPIGSTNFQMDAWEETSAACPDGVAQTIGYRVDYGSDVEFGTGNRPRARDRNRIYLGPLSGSTLQLESTTNRCVFTSQFMTDVLAAFAALAGHSGPDPFGEGGMNVNRMVIWTRRGAAVKNPLIECWADDRPDYQRRRSDPGVKSQVAIDQD